MLDPDSEFVEFESDNTLDHLTDSVYSVMGIINKMQAVADRTVLLGEVRGDLMMTTDAASEDLKNVAAFNFKEANKYNVVSDYYAIINNCNYYLAHVDTAMQRRGRNVFLPEYAVVKSYRAWTYLQLAQIYGEVPLILEPLMTEKAALDAMNQPRVGMQEICKTFIEDLTPLVGVNQPNFGVVGDWDSEEFFIPMRVLLGDLCLWSGQYKEAATWYHDYLTDQRDPVMMSTNRSIWPNSTKYETPRLSYYTTSTAEYVTSIPMESRIFDGVISDLPNLYNSTTQNNYYYELTPSSAMGRISAAQVYCIEEKKSTQTDTTYVPTTGLLKDIYKGDLRYASNYSISSYGSGNEYSEYNSTMQSIEKVWRSRIPIYRRTMIYLRYAEALNRAGFPQSAMVVLKYGACDDNMKAYVDDAEREEAGQIIYFDPTYYRLDDGNGNRVTYGVHSLGSGDSHANAYYVLPQPDEALPSRADTVKYQIPFVEDMIIDEMALEGAFEGYRFYDLMRVADRRNKPEYLADRVAYRKEKVDAALQTLLMDRKNWFLPIR
jgi:hypothetical protein